MRFALTLVLLALLVGGGVRPAQAAGCEPKRCIGLVGYVPVLYSQSEIWWDTITWNGKTVKNKQHVFLEPGVPLVNSVVTLDWEGLPLLASAEAQANIDSLGNFNPQPDSGGSGYVLQHPPVKGSRSMRRGAHLRVLSYQTWAQARSNGVFNPDEFVQDVLFALVRYEGDPTPAAPAEK
jgi:hypothetical protein